MQLVLASQSPARLKVLRGAGIEPVQYVSGVDEDALASSMPGASPEQLVAALAEAKARTVAEAVGREHPDSVVIGCDSMLAHDGLLVGKPGSPEQARQFVLSRFPLATSGRSRETGDGSRETGVGSGEGSG